MSKIREATCTIISSRKSLIKWIAKLFAGRGILGTSPDENYA